MSPRLARFLTAYLLMLIGSMMGWTLFCMRISAHPSPVAENVVSLLLLGTMLCMLPFVSAVLGPIPTSFRIALFLMRPPLGVTGVAIVVLGCVLQYYLLSCAYRRAIPSGRMWSCWTWRLYLVAVSMAGMYNLMYLGSQ